MNDLSLDHVDLVREITRQSGAGGATVFLYDPLVERRRVHYLFNLGLSGETNRVYQDSICQRDPFLQAAALRAGDATGTLQIIDQREVEATDLEPATRSYWEFMQRRGFCESAASIRELAAGIYLVLGLIRQGCAAEDQRLSARGVRDNTERLFDAVSGPILRQALRRFWDDDAPDAQATLTGREREVVAELRRGASNKQISARLGLSEHTIENHLRRIYRKHGVHNRTSLLAALRPLTAAAPP